MLQCETTQRQLMALLRAYLTGQPPEAAAGSAQPTGRSFAGKRNYRPCPALPTQPRSDCLWIAALMKRGARSGSGRP